MSDYVQWSKVAGSNNGGNSKGKTDFLRLESGKVYRVRPLFYPYQFWKYFHKHNNRNRTAICDDPETCPVRVRHPELKKPSLRFAAYVIDRSDGKVKILEAPQSVFGPIGDQAEATKKNPGDMNEGSDWQIKVTGAGLKTRYAVSYLEQTPLSAEEKERVKEALDGDKKKLKTIFASNTPEDIEKKLFGDFEKNEDDDSSSDDFETSEVPASSGSSSVEDEFRW